MDAVSIDDQKENEFVKGFMKKNKIKALWTSGVFPVVFVSKVVLIDPRNIYD